MSDTARFTPPPFPEAPKKPWNPGPSSSYYSEYWSGVTEETVSAYEAQVAEWSKRKQEWYAVRAAMVKDAADLLISAGFPASALVDDTAKRKRFGRYQHRTMPLSEALAPFLPRHDSNGTPSTYYEREWLKKLAAKESEKKRTAAADAATTEAVAYCLAVGKVIGKDFTTADALDVATDIAREKAIAERLAGLKDGDLIGFSGDDNCENCGGWDGKSHRCECGNRRVSWSWEGGINGYLVAEAY